ncbi:hypothetical protein [Rivularia sp. UHCC 0363]|nr:hypothetical protein [Rivularia sp. UHCC 0363]MEA5595896.1 hypothetical protein [Rivularia sp. UHCC 0363]
MLQVVATITFIFIGTAALFAWLQYRPSPEERNLPNTSLYTPVLNK